MKGQIDQLLGFLTSVGDLVVRATTVAACRSANRDLWAVARDSFANFGSQAHSRDRLQNQSITSYSQELPIWPARRQFAH